MNRFFRRFFEKFAEGLLMISSTVTTITVLLIIIFLFKEGLGIFSDSPLEEGYVLAVNDANPIQHLTADEIKAIFDREVHTWDKVGGTTDSITLLHLDDLPDHFTEEELGSNLEYVPARVNDFIRAHAGVIAFIPKAYMPADLNGHIIEVPDVSALEFLTDKEWFPTAQPAAQLGVLPLILGTLWVSFGAILIALPLGLATAIFMAEIANKKVRNILKPMVELLAGIPSVVYGFFGLILVVPAIKDLFGLPVGETGLAGSIILGIMALPTIITISEDALRTTPRALKEASLALGASQWQTITKVTVPYASSGITAAIILGIGRAIGETMAVLMVTGNAAVIPNSFFDPLRTIPATIAAELGEAPYGGLHFKSLFALGAILFIITFLINLVFELIARKRKL